MWLWTSGAGLILHGVHEGFPERRALCASESTVAMNELNEDSVIERLLHVVPELLPICEEHQREYGFDFLHGSHGTFMTEVLPELQRWLELPDYHDPLRRLFEFIETMAVEGDRHVADIVRCTIAPDLLSLRITDPRLFEVARPYIGRQTLAVMERLAAS